ncbi:MAG TPA: wax ester/triacylglycerol synthase family O-acyltransferase [Candidatus Binatia bacterium]|nr:wax ester/triacylglycerol synthase family O-acyltransferase [Candidatus Binatia bacterium]
MTYAYCERLSALDNSFLDLEDASTHMHIGAVALFEAAPLRTADGGVDVERIRAAVATGLHRMPRYRQRIERVPIFGHPVWVDDARFNLSYHLRHTHLPRPGDARQLKRLVGRLFSQQLDRGKPLWEMWVVEGLPEERFALVTKVHHCLIDGVGSVELTGLIMRPSAEPDPRLLEPPPPWLPRPVPSCASLVAGEMLHRGRMPLGALGRAARDPGGVLAAARDTAVGLFEAVAPALRPASATPLNTAIGPHRRFDWTETSLDDVRRIRRLGGTVNDAVLAILSGGLRHFLHRRGVDVQGLEFRAMLPVNVRTALTRRQAGNQVAMLVVRLPLDEADPRRRLERVVRETGDAKRSRQATGMRALEELSDVTFTTLLVLFGRMTAAARPFNMVVTNVPGPPFPVHLLGARMTACYPLVPLFRNMALNVALFSYAGRLFWGFNADWDAVPDLHDLVEAVERECARLCDAAGAASGTPAA